MGARKTSQPTLSVESMTFPADQLRKWQAGDHRILKKGNVSEFVKKILKEKAGKRKGTRFFGEAYVATELCIGVGWYGSFKWLTSSQWTTGKGVEEGLPSEFAAALQEHFGQEKLEHLQSASHRLFKEHEDELGGSLPVAPDLWLIIDGVHHFIECKLPHDTLAPHQIAGLALIAKHLGESHPVVTRVIELRQDPKEIVSKFDTFVR